MLYCNCYHYNKILCLLDDNNTVAARYTTRGIGSYYQGNFWWASKYIKTLNRDIGSEYLDPESWVLKNKQSNKQSNKHINN